jgi:hypothetical protein
MTTSKGWVKEPRRLAIERKKLTFAVFLIRAFSAAMVSKFRIGRDPERPQPLAHHETRGPWKATSTSFKVEKRARSSGKENSWSISRSDAHANQGSG